MLLAEKLHWLVNGGSNNEIHGEMSRLSRAMPLGADLETLIKAWTSWIRSGVAFMEFEKAVSYWKPKDLAARVTRDQVKHGELLWQAEVFVLQRPTPCNRLSRPGETITTMCDRTVH